MLVNLYSIIITSNHRSLIDKFMEENLSFEIVDNLEDLDKFTSYPVNKHFIIIHSNISSNEINEVATKNHYTVVHLKNKGIEINNLDLYRRCTSFDEDYFIIGDLHSCVDELKLLIEGHNEQII